MVKMHNSGSDSRLVKNSGFRAKVTAINSYKKSQNLNCSIQSELNCPTIQLENMNIAYGPKLILIVGFGHKC